MPVFRHKLLPGSHLRPFLFAQHNPGQFHGLGFREICGCDILLDRA